MKTTVSLAILAAAFAFMGFCALVSPEIVISQFGIPALSPAGRSEVRAVHGGFEVAIAGLLVYAIADAGLRPGITLTVAVALFGMAAGRILSATMDLSLPKAALLHLVIEASGGTVLLLAR